MANYHDYFANTNSYKSWARLAISTKNVFELVYSIHGYSYENRGIMAISGFVFERVKIDKKTTDTTDTKSCSLHIFQFNYKEKEKDILNRFDSWLDKSVLYALAYWHKTI